MYQPPHFREDRLEVQHGLIRSHPLGLLITAGPGGLQANAIPFLVYGDASPQGTLRAQIAQGNPPWREHRRMLSAPPRRAGWRMSTPQKAQPDRVRGVENVSC